MSVIHDFYIPREERKKAIKKFIDFFDRETSIIIEDGLYDYTEQYCKHNSNYRTIAQAIYKDNLNNLIFNFNVDSQTMKKIKKDIDKEKFNPYNFAFLRPTELDKDKWIKIMMRMSTTEEKLKDLPSVTWKPCYRCKGTEYFKYQLQTRSIDEPMTTFYNCKQCGRNYSVNG
jgi:DNA-directed RNA polymerase subunit M/transcription elongation factor TFIIS